MDSLNVTLLGEMLTFAVLIFVTVKFVWPPIINAINERQKHIAEGLAAAERGQQNLTLAQQKAIKIVQDAKNDAQNILNQAAQQASVVVEQSKSVAKKEGERLLVLARADIAKEKAAARQELQQEITKLVLLIAEKFLRDKNKELQGNAKDNNALLEQLMREL